MVVDYSDGMRWWVESGKVRTVISNRFEWIRKSAPLNCSRVLDVGCADGKTWSQTLHNWIGMDYKIYAGYNKPHVLGIGEALPFKDKSFDLVSMCDIWEHVNEPQLLLHEALRVSGYRVVITVPLEYFWDDCLKPFTNGEHIRSYTVDSFLLELSSVPDNYDMDVCFILDPVKISLSYSKKLAKISGWAFLGAIIQLCGGKYGLRC